MKESLTIVVLLLMSSNFVDSSIAPKKGVDPPAFPLDKCDTGRGWLQYNEHCYKLISPPEGGKSASAIESICEVEGPSKGGSAISFLADVHSQAENDFIAEVVAGGNRAWLGASRFGGNWYWRINVKRGNQEPGLPYTNWKPNEPSNTLNRENCIEINRGPPGRWNDLYCSRKRPGVCKYSIAEWADGVVPK
ncbi:Lectin [Holothuria leucospilota]|uniref:Lectin n=1 Tax=Holothuria leucospilota TaxID=206669 RepID=A0A9Q1BL57_HOLLE|nr:Lectin [Holothuria leucospilota]